MNGDGPPASGSVPQQSLSLVGQVLDGRYRIIRKLGEGGMGEVFAAEHVHIEKRFAIKLLRPEIVSNAEAVTRFRQEARSSSSIGHRNIIAIEDFGQVLRLKPTHFEERRHIARSYTSRPGPTRRVSVELAPGRSTRH